ncbi:hypothetical protein [Streptomyces sp. NBC_00038]|uniref:hypothetical protein n=1 Tax=Streptomyces sp. NBC_00038 TaxID=2903615 RepID=UPI002255AE29|nr:hypothetical protein [Streptomyces sp. NBC_00038]MCX5559826.1 hypothetical protein [Streptomyces sp. NBC_00038]
MDDYHALDFGQFVDDQGTAREMVPSSVIAVVPAAKAAAERFGSEVRLDFLDDRAVHWMLFQRREETAKAGLQGCLLAIPVFILGFGAWPFWDLVASQRSQQFQIAFIVVDALLLSVVSALLFLWRLRDLRDKALRNTRCRARLYRKIIGIARQGGADIPRLYPYYGMYATSRKFFPEAPDRPIPQRDQAP